MLSMLFYVAAVTYLSGEMLFKQTAIKLHPFAIWFRLWMLNVVIPVYGSLEYLPFYIDLQLNFYVKNLLNTSEKHDLSPL